MIEPYSNQDYAGRSLAESVQWIEQLVFGQLPMAIAVLAVALMGFRLMFGYARPKEMTRIVLGCFIIFGAPAIARSIAGVPQSSYALTQVDIPAAAPPVTTATPPNMFNMPPAPINPFDPYSESGSPH